MPTILKGYLALVEQHKPQLGDQLSTLGNLHS
jgi:hypothetical protein